MSDDILILKKRAEKLASGGIQETAKAGYIEVVEFMLANEHYAIESTYIREVYPIKDLSPLPSVPAYVTGIVNVRRKIVSVLDLKRVFDLGTTEKNGLNKILIVEKNDKEFGILTDQVVGIRQIKLESIQAALPTMTGLRQKFLKGITSDRLIILDGDKLLANSELIVNEKVD